MKATVQAIKNEIIMMLRRSVIVLGFHLGLGIGDEDRRAGLYPDKQIVAATITEDAIAGEVELGRRIHQIG